jgi:hypothetical protein
MSPENIKHIDSVACRALFHFCNELIHRLERTRCGGYTTTPWATAAAPLWRRRSRVMSCVLRHTPSGKRHVSCGGWARAYGQEADRRPGRSAERERRRRQRRRLRACSPHEMTAPMCRVATNGLVQQPGPCRALPPPLLPSRPKPTYMGAPRSRKEEEKGSAGSQGSTQSCDQRFRGQCRCAIKARSRKFQRRGM